MIDKQLVWYGEINYLGFEKSAQGAMYLSNVKIAKELLHWLKESAILQMEDAIEEYMMAESGFQEW